MCKNTRCMRTSGKDKTYVQVLGGDKIEMNNQFNVSTFKLLNYEEDKTRYIAIAICGYRKELKRSLQNLEQCRSPWCESRINIEMRFIMYQEVASLFYIN